MKQAPGWLGAWNCPVMTSVPQDYKYEEHKAQIPLIIHHKE